MHVGHRAAHRSLGGGGGNPFFAITTIPTKYLHEVCVDLFKTTTTNTLTRTNLVQDGFLCFRQRTLLNHSSGVDTLTRYYSTNRQSNFSSKVFRNFATMPKKESQKPEIQAKRRFSILSILKKPLVICFLTANVIAFNYYHKITPDNKANANGNEGIQTNFTLFANILEQFLERAFAHTNLNQEENLLMRQQFLKKDSIKLKELKMKHKSCYSSDAYCKRRGLRKHETKVNADKEEMSVNNNGQLNFDYSKLKRTMFNSNDEVFINPFALKSSIIRRCNYLLGKQENNQKDECCDTMSYPRTPNNQNHLSDCTNRSHVENGKEKEKALKRKKKEDFKEINGFAKSESSPDRDRDLRGKEVATAVAQQRLITESDENKSDINSVQNPLTSNIKKQLFDGSPASQVCSDKPPLFVKPHQHNIFDSIYNWFWPSVVKSCKDTCLDNFEKVISEADFFNEKPPMNSNSKKSNVLFQRSDESSRNSHRDCLSNLKFQSVEKNKSRENEKEIKPPNLVLMNSKHTESSQTLSFVNSMPISLLSSTSMWAYICSFFSSNLSNRENEMATSFKVTNNTYKLKRAICSKYQENNKKPKSKNQIAKSYSNLQFDSKRRLLCRKAKSLHQYRSDKKTTLKHLSSTCMSKTKGFGNAVHNLCKSSLDICDLKKNKSSDWFNASRVQAKSRRAMNSQLSSKKLKLKDEQKNDNTPRCHDVRKSKNKLFAHCGRSKSTKQITSLSDITHCTRGFNSATKCSKFNHDTSLHQVPLLDGIKKTIKEVESTEKELKNNAYYKILKNLEKYSEEEINALF
ncbi:hypothetical protein FQA39_LY12604 [Lamprigera yunnana]|nr:hypothetical protein FQA39_LY12604 [Lamprigera yunnana]